MHRLSLADAGSLDRPGIADNTFESEVAELRLVPGETGGVFVVRLDGEVLFDRAVEGGFPELRLLKQRIRDRVAPGRDLGHSDSPVAESGGADS